MVPGAEADTAATSKQASGTVCGHMAAIAVTTKIARATPDNMLMALPTNITGLR